MKKLTLLRFLYHFVAKCHNITMSKHCFISLILGLFLVKKIPHTGDTNSLDRCG